MRMILAALAALLALASSPAHASFTQDDRYFDSRAPAAAPQKARKVERRHARHARQRHIQKVVSRLPSLPRDKLTLTAADEQLQASRETIHHAPKIDSTPVPFYGPRPRAWCGWFLGKLLGLHDRALWLARNWAAVGRPAAKQPGAIVVWRHHVGKITAVRADGAIRVLSGNDGHAVRNRWRSARGVIAYRAL